MTAQRVGLIGVGNMGGRIARRMLDHGVNLIAFDTDKAKLDAIGVPAAASIADLAKRTDIILLSLPDSRIIESVAKGPEGLLAHVRPGQIVVDLSTARVASTKALYQEYQSKGVELVDAGISGGAAAAEKGALTIMAGGSSEALEKVKWVLDTFSKKIFYMGRSGAGHAAKILNNFLNGISLAATAEVMVVAKKLGLDLETFLDVVNNSSGVNFATLNRFPFIIKGNYLEGGLTSKLMAKDLSLYIELVKELGVVSLQGASCLTAFEVAIGLGYGDQISNRVVDALGDLAGGVRLNEG
ncbi:MAG: NAD(P)-dependent oxidoreductase [Alicyclobacillus sp.]|nr:NAD(P)-dependent oxidoreductase [Alicyclobacillus sp.]